MSSYSIDVLGIGEPIVDYIIYVDYDFLEENDLDLNTRLVISEARAREIFKKIEKFEVIKTAGGFASTTVSCVGSLGGRASMIGKVGPDEDGHILKKAFDDFSIDFDFTPTSDEFFTSVCIIFVTPNAERTMCTCHSAAAQLSTLDLDPSYFYKAPVAYIEPCLIERPITKRTMFHAMDLAHEHNMAVASNLVDVRYISEHFADLQTVIENSDIIFGNIEEFKKICETDSIETIQSKLGGRVKISVMTCGAEGSKIITKDQIIEIPSILHGELKDTTGAGDSYTGGFLYGYSQGMSLYQCGLLGAEIAGHIVTKNGARPPEHLEHIPTQVLKKTA